MNRVQVTAILGGIFTSCLAGIIFFQGTGVSGVATLMAGFFGVAFLVQLLKLSNSTR